MTLRTESQDASAVAVSAEWRLLGLLFERPRDGWSNEVERLSLEVGSNDLQLAAVAAQDAREATYLDVFGPGGCVSPREVAYRGREDLGQVVADIAGFHRAFAFHPQVEDPLDHVAVEASLVGYLRLKEAYARALADVEAAQTCATAAERFIETHLRFLAEPLAQRLAAAAAPPHLVLAARALKARTGPAPAGSRGSEHEGACPEFECDGCEPPAG